MQETTELKERLERERADLESRLRQQADVQHERATELDKQVRTLLDTKYKLDTKVTELRTKFVALEKDLDEKSQECERLRRENRNLDSEKHENAKQLSRHLIRLSALEQEVQDKGDLLSNLTMQLENQAAHRSALEGSWKEAQAAAERAEERASISSSEINKCYQIIDKLQMELRSMKSKVKLKGQVTSQQDTLIQEKQAAIEKGLSDNSTLQQEVNRLKLENESLKKKSDDLQGKLEEAQELVKSNEQMIQWLNQQLTEAQLGKIGTGGASSRYMYRPANGLSYSTSTGFASSRVGIDAPVTGTSLSSSNSIGGISNPSNTFIPQYPLSSTMPYSITSTPYAQSMHMKTNTKSLSSALPSAYTSTTRSCCVAKAAAAAATTNPSTSTACSKVQYRPSHLAKGLHAENYSGSGCLLQTDAYGPVSWPDDTSSWISKIGLGSGVVLPKPQLSFADVRSGFGGNSGGKSTATSFSRSASGVDRSQPRSSPQNPRSQSPPSPQLSKAQSPHSPPQSPGPSSTRSRSPRQRSSPVRQKSPQLQNGYCFSKNQVVSNSDIALSNCK
ncbi:hypothetical protein Mapa_005322 [Marchantia paleacea]|nr:hypothetical protein Mapa_005322 [Marchantia paleacea]